jgi:biopolymer transport protein ExbB
VALHASPRDLARNFTAIIHRSRLALSGPLPRLRAGYTDLWESLLLSILQAAGWPILPLVLCSIVALALVIERCLSLRTSRVAPGRLVDEVLSVTRTSLPPADTITKLADNSTLGLMLAQGLRAVAAEPRISEANLRNAFETAGRDAVHQLERNLNALGTIASAAPLLGLLGTVIGMIEIFGASGATNGNAGANPMELAHGISVALYNTAFGLIVAIPSLMFYRHFRAKVDGHALALEQAAERMLPHLLRLGSGRR